MQGFHTGPPMRLAEALPLLPGGPGCLVLPVTGWNWASDDGWGRRYVLIEIAVSTDAWSVRQRTMQSARSARDTWKPPRTLPFTSVW